MGHSEAHVDTNATTTENQTENQEIQQIAATVYTHRLTMLWAHLEIFSLGFPLESETLFSIDLCFSFIFIEMFPH